MSLEFGYKEGKKVARVRLILFLAPDTKRLASSLARERCVICLRPEELPKNRPFSSDWNELASQYQNSSFPRIIEFVSVEYFERRLG